MSPALSERKRERLAEKASRAPDLVVIVPLKKRVDLPPPAAKVATF